MYKLDINKCFCFTNEGTYRIKPCLISPGIPQEYIESSFSCNCAICMMNRKKM